MLGPRFRIEIFILQPNWEEIKKYGNNEPKCKKFLVLEGEVSHQRFEIDWPSHFVAGGDAYASIHHHSALLRSEHVAGLPIR